eukprot:TRINITY_DN39467_c0_g1_i2.p1 TRINITY_DN39467_c0_g1~~TRINITY_DN39467_c0_g1_i2.p1  ORF type:complete len:604 (+),score=103.55 TRINITY_DN39467_c0_g1_i2:40-1812(+)
MVVDSTEDTPRRFGPLEDPFETCGLLTSFPTYTVHRCKLVRGEKQFAVKSMHIEPADDSKKAKAASEKKIQNLRREIRNMRELHHPKIVNIHGAFYEPVDQPREAFLVMDLCEGGTLLSKIQEELQACDSFPGLGGSEMASRHVAKQILDGLSYMHERDIIHRDLQPDHIYIERSYPPPVSHDDDKSFPREFLDIKIGGLGRSRRVEEKALNRNMSKVGTLGFVAPEVLDQEYDELADVWSLGVLIYMMLCGLYPYDITGVDDYDDNIMEIKDCENWRNCSREARELVQKLLVLRQHRLTILQCLAHAWIEGDGSSPLCTSPKDSVHEHRKNTMESWRMSEGADCAVVKEVRGRYGYAVDSLKIRKRDGSDEFHGGPGGDREHVYKLANEELIVSASQECRHNYLGNSITLHTSLGRTLEILGNQAQSRACFVAPAGSQIVGLQFVGSLLQGTHTSEIASGTDGAIEKISARVGSSVDRIVFHLRNGKVRSYGGDGGSLAGTWTLAKDEYIKVVDQNIRDAYLGNSIIFQTSLGKVIRIFGVERSKTRRIAAPLGSQIYGLEFAGPDLVRAKLCPAGGNVTMMRTLEADV